MTAAPAPELLQVVFLAVLQGLTEFLPVSSSGHLAAAALVWPSLARPGVTLELALHLGTTVAVLVYYRDLVADLVRSLVDHTIGPEGLAGRRWIAFLVAGSVPTALIGLAGENLIRGAFENPRAIAACWFATGVVLMSTRWVERRERTLGLATALAIGVAQGAAILPGVSRSGVTISLALLLGVAHRQAVIFSFLLSVPAILGASLLDALEPGVEGSSAGFLSVEIAFATLCAGAVGYACIGLVHRATRQRWWHQFAWYCWLLAVLLAVFAGQGG